MEKIANLIMADNKMINSFNKHERTLNFFEQKINDLNENPTKSTASESGRGFLTILFNLTNEKVIYPEATAPNCFTDILENICKMENDCGQGGVSECIQIESSIYYNTKAKFNWCDEMDSD